MLKNTINLICRKKYKIGETITKNYSATKIYRNPNIIHMKSVIPEQSKPSHKLHKAIRQAEKVSQVSDAGKNSNSLLYSETKKSEKFLNEKCKNNETISSL